MCNNIIKLKKDFERIKKTGWIKSVQKGYGGIGVTFEQILGINQNELEIPDYGDIEIKTKRSYSKSYSSLFNCTPTGPHYHEIERLKDKFGYPDKVLKECKVLYTNVCATEKIKVGLNFYFQLEVCKRQEKLFLKIFDKTNNVIEKIVYWDFDILEEKLLRKLKTLAFIKALSKQINNEEFFKYYDLKIYKLKGMEEFIKLIEEGLIRINFKIGVFRNGNKIGKIYDHGTSFCIQSHNLHKLYNLIE